MGTVDIVTKEYMRGNAVFADISSTLKIKKNCWIF